MAGNIYIVQVMPVRRQISLGAPVMSFEEKFHLTSEVLLWLK